MAFCCGLLLCPSVMAFWFGGLLIEGSLLVEGSFLVESGLLLWPSGKVAFWLKVVFCYGLLLWPSSKAFWCGGLVIATWTPPRRPYRKATLNQKTTFKQKATKPEGYQTRRLPNQKATKPEDHQTRSPPQTQVLPNQVHP